MRHTATQSLLYAIVFIFPLHQLFTVSVPSSAVPGWHRFSIKEATLKSTLKAPSEHYLSYSACTTQLATLRLFPLYNMRTLRQGARNHQWLLALHSSSYTSHFSPSPDTSLHSSFPGVSSLSQPSVAHQFLPAAFAIHFCILFLFHPSTGPRTISNHLTTHSLAGYFVHTAGGRKAVQ